MAEITSSELSKRKHFQFNPDLMMKHSDRNLGEYQQIARFKIEDIPQHGKILNIGSGIAQQFEKDVKIARPDIRVISVDPSTVKMVYLPEMGGLTKEGMRQRNQYLQKHGGGYTVAAYGHELPMKNDSMDLALDVLGPAYYIREVDTLKEYMREVIRTLKPGASFHLAAIGGSIGAEIQLSDDLDADALNIQHLLDDLKLPVKNNVFIGNLPLGPCIGAIITKNK